MFINTCASYIRIIVNAIVTLIVTRIALKALGVEDFGLYNLIAGTIALLSFVNSALLVSAQRFFSICIGESNLNSLNKYFYTSKIIHISFALFIVIFLLSIQPLLFDILLNIAEDKVTIGKVVYNIMIVSSGITMISIPYSALMNAYEDIAALSFINIGSYLIRLGAALSLLYLTSNLLLIYSVIILLSIFFKVFGSIGWCRIKYPQIRGSGNSNFSKSILKDMLGFSGWNTLGSFSIVIRDEGVAVILNMFFGTAINAAYGVANQVNALVLSFAANLTTVFAPTIIQAKGAGEEDRMRFMGVFSSKLSYVLSSMVALPIIVFLPSILHIWLVKIPHYTEIFCKLIIFCFLIQQFYPGINRMIYASGKIRNYQLGIFFAFVNILPLSWLILKLGYPPQIVLYLMVLSQTIVLIITIVIAKKNCDLDIKEFTAYLFKGGALFILSLFICQSLINYHNLSISIGLIIMTSIMISSVYCIIIFFSLFDKKEKLLLSSAFHHLLRKYGKKSN